MNNSQKNLITNYTERMKRNRQKKFLILRFLRHQIWSNQDILKQVISVNSRQAIHKTLVEMEVEDLIARHTFSMLGHTLTVWGITNHGQSFAFFPAKNETKIEKYFEPRRISDTTLRHKFDLQTLYIKAANAGYKSWLDGDRLKVPRGQNRPDAICCDQNNTRLALECERTFKSTKRYEQILIRHLMQIKNGKISKVIWVSPNIYISDRLKTIILGIKSVRFQGQNVIINPKFHHINLHFCTYEDWPNYE